MSKSSLTLYSISSLALFGFGTVFFVANASAGAVAGQKKFFSLKGVQSSYVAKNPFAGEKKFFELSTKKKTASATKIVKDDNLDKSGVDAISSLAESEGKSLFGSVKPENYLLEKTDAFPSHKKKKIKRKTVKTASVKKTAKKSKKKSFFGRLFSAIPGKNRDSFPSASSSMSDRSYDFYNKKKNAKSKEWVWPVERTLSQRISSPFGYRTHPITRKRKLHKGVDIAAPVGTKVLAAADGVVDRVKRHRYLGKYVRVQHGDGLHAYYGHLSRWNVKVGDKVEAGEVIGRVGSTGRSTGPHLDFSLRKNDTGKAINPLAKLGVPEYIRVGRKARKSSGSRS